MSLFFSCILSFLIWTTPNVHASQLVPQKPNMLRKSKYIIIGKVLNSQYDKKTFKGLMKIFVITSLRGNLSEKTLNIAVDKNPLSGFDVLLNDGDIAVFFIRNLNGKTANLTTKGASAVFPKGYFQ